MARAAGLCIVLATSCAHNVNQNKATGPDGHVKGARKIEMDSGEGIAKGIVTYPGGDRVDWKSVELPKNKRGTLNIELKWRPPRPHLRLAFDVFDEWYHRVAHSRGIGHHHHGYLRIAHVDNAAGKYYIRIFAVRRGDAGKYRLRVDFRQDSGPLTVDVAKLDIPDPPHLAAVPAAAATCDPYTFDVKNPACRSVCPAANAPPGWPACRGKCPSPPDVNNPACWKTMPCPNPPRREVLRCKPSDFPKCPDFSHPDPKNPNCDHAPPVTARVIGIAVQGRAVLITISAGSDRGVKRGWRGQVLVGQTDSPLGGGSVTVIRVGKKRTIGKVFLTSDQVTANPRVKLTPPP